MISLWSPLKKSSMNESSLLLQVRNVGVVITDGKSTVDHNRTQIEGQLARDDDIALFVVGATDQINIDELKVR